MSKVYSHNSKQHQQTSIFQTSVLKCNSSMGYSYYLTFYDKNSKERLLWTFSWKGWAYVHFLKNALIYVVPLGAPVIVILRWRPIGENTMQHREVTLLISHCRIFHFSPVVSKFKELASKRQRKGKRIDPDTEKGTRRNYIGWKHCKSNSKIYKIHVVGSNGGRGEHENDDSEDCEILDLETLIINRFFLMKGLCSASS